MTSPAVVLSFWMVQCIVLISPVSRPFSVVSFGGVPIFVNCGGVVSLADVNGCRLGAERTAQQDFCARRDPDPAPTTSILRRALLLEWYSCGRVFQEVTKATVLVW